MPIINANDKKKNLLAYKEKLLEEIQYYDKSIEDFRDRHKNNNYFEDADSSDEENTFPNAVDIGPEIQQLKKQQSTLKTCLQATQELTSLTVLQSEVNVLVQGPELDGERPVKEAGTWNEVTAECRIDLVPFTIAFYMHTPVNPETLYQDMVTLLIQGLQAELEIAPHEAAIPCRLYCQCGIVVTILHQANIKEVHRKFGPTSFRSIQVALVKKSNEVELADSVLQTIKHPSDAIEVVRSYAVAYRSRRTTLARLVNKYARSLYMEAHPEGGFVLKCANLLEILWRLENKWSPVAPFHHRMKFDLEYMDESYIKIITQAHKQLLDPSLETDERTLLLSKIITTCLQARGPVDSESDLESRQTESQTELEAGDKDTEVMAPPKNLPKKYKTVVSKDKNHNKDVKEKTVPQKRVSEDLQEENVKKMKKSDEIGVREKENNKDVTKLQKNKENVGNKVTNKQATTNVKNDDTKKKSDEKTAENNVVKKVIRDTEQTENIDTVTNIEKNDETNGQNKNIEKVKVTKKRRNDDNIQTDKENNENSSNNIDTVINKENNDDTNENNQNKNIEMTKVAKKHDNVQSDVAKDSEKYSKNKDTVTNIEKNDKTNENKQNKNTGISKVPKKRKNDENIQSDVAKNNENCTKKIKSADVNQDTNTESRETKTLNGDPNANIDISDDKQPQNIEKPNEPPKKVKSITVEEKKKKKENKNINEVLKDNNKSTKQNDNVKKVDRQSKMSIANDKKFDILTKKLSGNIEKKDGSTKAKNSDNDQIKNIATSKKNVENNDKNKNSDPKPNTNDVDHLKTKNPGRKLNNDESNSKKGNTANTKQIQTMKKVIDKNSNTNTKKDKIINKKPEKINLNKPLEKTDKNPIKLSIKSVRTITQKSPSHKNVLKIQNAGNTKVLIGNTGKENIGKSKIPQKKLSMNSEINFKMNPIRVSPRQLSTKFKSTSQLITKNIKKDTNIQRLMKRPVSKTMY